MIRLMQNKVGKLSIIGFTNYLAAFMLDFFWYLHNFYILDVH